MPRAIPAPVGPASPLYVLRRLPHWIRTTTWVKETNADCLSGSSPSRQGEAHSIGTARRGESLPEGLHRYIGFACKLSRRSLLARVFLLDERHGGRTPRASRAPGPEASCAVPWGVSDGNREVRRAPRPTGRFPREPR